MPDSHRKLIVLSLKWYDIRIHQGVLEYAKDQKWDVLASPHQPEALEIPEADGQIVMLGPNDQRRSRLVQQSNIPAIDLSHYSSLDIPRVYPDSVQTGRLAAAEFMGRGFTQFAVYSTQTHWYVDERRKGFCETLGERGYTAESWHFPQTDSHKGSFSPSGPARETIQEWLTESPKPVAVYAIEDEGAAMLMRACSQLGISVPEQVALIGTNNDPVVCPYTEVPLSSIDLNWEGVGYEAAAQLDRLMQGQPLEEPLTLVPPKGLVVRKSSDTVAVADLRVAKALTYIQENSHRHVSVTEITKVLGMPLRTLQWAFQKSMSRSIQEEISKRRVERVKDMLLNTDRNVGQIATDLGFSSAQYMNHFFVKSTGGTPNEYRQKQLALRS
ncbi:MAG: DNA-binding transcriptional regulator [Verrucomicrobiota bacterium]